MILQDYGPLITVSEAKDILHVGKETIYRLLESDQIVGFKIGRGWKISTESLEKFICSSSGLE